MKREIIRASARSIALVLLGAMPNRLAAAPAWHPMPNSVIAVSFGDARVTLDVAIPLPELRLAMQGDWPSDAATRGDSQRAAFARYFAQHVFIVSKGGARQPMVLQSTAIWEANDENVGNYQELRLRFVAHDGPAFDSRDFVLAYDAVIHQVPNHFALVEVIQDFRTGVLSDAAGSDLGVIRYDFATNRTPPFRVQAEGGSAWRGFRSVVALGFRHVTTGFDHLLFLLTLLIVAPLRVVNGRWSLFQGWRYAARRFLVISASFTLGHSMALVTGVYELVHLPTRAVEVMIALSIMIAAVHAIRPLFPQREWLVAAAFGTIHGLAFAEALSGLALGPVMRGVAVAGFNLGIEAGQLTAMALAIPLLVLSRWRVYQPVRIVTMLAAAGLAGLWAVQRGRVQTMPIDGAVASATGPATPG